MNDGTPRQQIAERIKNATNILVTVSRDPSVDELSAALALTLMLNKMEKHATAVFSGKVPPAITFLEPNKTFEHTVDSLRDFIIALDKNKADRLRYKVEDDVVRIFITPYRTTITEKDLQFSQGDFNVELIVALGVERREDLDTAVTAHGRILHDAATVTLNTKQDTNSLGVVDWQESEASSLCEMLVNLDELLGSKIDEQIATALLTGIVAATQRFKNAHTSPRVMTMAAQLMAAGANQQVIANKLEEAQAIPQDDEQAKDGTRRLDEGKSKKLQPEQPEEKKPDGEMSIAHEEVSSPTEEATESSAEESKGKAEKPKVDESNPPTPKASAPTPKGEAASSPDEASKELDQAIASATVPGKKDLSVNDLKKDLDAASKELDQAAEGAAKPDAKIKAQGWRDQEIAPPSMGGTLNATTESAEEENRQAEQEERNRTILTHDKPMGGEPQNVPSPINSYGTGVPSYEPPSVDPFANPKDTAKAPGVAPSKDSSSAPVVPAPAPAPVSSVLPPPPAETLADIEAAAHSKEQKPEMNDARRAVEDALNAMPFDPARQPVDSLNAQPLSPTPIDHKEEQPIAPPPVSPAAPVPAPPVELTGAPLPPPPPMPDFTSLPPLPPVTETPALPSYDTNVNQMPAQSPAPSQQPAPSTPLPPITPPVAPPQAPSNDPSQFRIPGQ